MTRWEAEAHAKYVQERSPTAVTQVGSHVTNGERRYVVHVTHIPREAGKAETIS
jgi:hypothetical protein